MSEHVLLVGREEGLAARYRRYGPDVAVSVLCRTEHVSRVESPGHCARVLALPAQAGMEEWVGVARAVHAAHPVTRIALFGEQDCDRAAAVGEALGVATHRPETVAWVQDKHAMRARLRAVGLEDAPGRSGHGPRHAAGLRRGARVPAGRQAERRGRQRRRLRRQDPGGPG